MVGALLRLLVTDGCGGLCPEDKGILITRLTQLQGAKVSCALRSCLFMSQLQSGVVTAPLVPSSQHQTGLQWVTSACLFSSIGLRCHFT
jgi:hypothetical protein